MQDRIPMVAWIVVALALCCIAIWGGVQPEDPLSPWIATDKMRHIFAFGVMALCASLQGTRFRRLLSFGLVLVFAVVLELIQEHFSATRVMSKKDVLASWIGAAAGYGAGRVLNDTFDAVRVLRDWVVERGENRQRRTS